MGWCSEPTRIFDAAVKEIIEPSKDPKEAIKALINILENGDWDCQHSSSYWDHPLVQAAFKDIHPHWFEEDEIITSPVASASDGVSLSPHHP